MEEKYVHNVYDYISENFNNTRAYVWKSIKNFILGLKENSLILDCGCGNGKNMEINKKCYFIGFDYSEKLVKICKNKNLNILQCNIKKIPLANPSFYSYKKLSNNKKFIISKFFKSDIEYFKFDPIKENQKPFPQNFKIRMYFLKSFFYNIYKKVKNSLTKSGLI